MKVDLTSLTDHENYNVTIVMDNGKIAKVYANWLHNSELDYWKGWSCDAGVNRITVTEDFEVYGSRCKHDYLGNLNSGFELREETICRKDRCTGSTDDLTIGKRKILDKKA